MIRFFPSVSCFGFLGCELALLYHSKAVEFLAPFLSVEAV